MDKERCRLEKSVTAIKSHTGFENLIRFSSTVKTSLQSRRASHLQVPDVFTFLRDPLDRVAHQGDQHVEQQDVSEDDVQDEQDVEDLLVLNVIGELQISHSNGELEQLQDCITDVIETWLLALERFCIKHPSLCRCVVGRISRIGKGVVYEGDDGCEGGGKVKSSAWKTSEVFTLQNESLTSRKSKKQDGVDAQKVKQVAEDHLKRGKHLKGTVHHPKNVFNSLIIYSTNISGLSQQNTFLNN